MALNKMQIIIILSIMHKYMQVKCIISSLCVSRVFDEHLIQINIHVCRLLSEIARSQVNHIHFPSKN
jgi:hypothetical protein